jgi:hypothetical protein
MEETEGEIHRGSAKEEKEPDDAKQTTQTEEEVLPDLSHNCIIALRPHLPIHKKYYLSVEDLQSHHGFDTGLVLRDWCDNWEKFRLLKHNNKTIALQNMAGGFLSPHMPQDKGWTFRKHCQSWELLDVEVETTTHHLSKCIRLSTRVVGSKLQKRYLAVSRREEKEEETQSREGESPQRPAVIQAEEPFSWEVVLVDVPIIDISALFRQDKYATTRLTQFRYPNALPHSILHVVLKVLRAHKDIGFFQVIGHGISMDLFALFQHHFGALPFVSPSLSPPYHHP